MDEMRKKATTERIAHVAHVLVESGPESGLTWGNYAYALALAIRGVAGTAAQLGDKSAEEVDALIRKIVDAALSLPVAVVDSEETGLPPGATLVRKADLQ